MKFTFAALFLGATTLLICNVGLVVTRINPQLGMTTWEFDRIKATAIPTIGVMIAASLTWAVLEIINRKWATPTLAPNTSPQA
jgi:hypothetical protein